MKMPIRRGARSGRQGLDPKEQAGHGEAAMKTRRRGNGEPTDLKQAMTTLKALLPDYRAVAEATCYYYAKAELRRLQEEASEAGALEDLPALTDRAWRLARALERAVAEWSGEEFCAPERRGYGNAGLHRR